MSDQRTRAVVLFRRVMAYLALGLATTVLIAWVCAVVFNPLGDPYGASPRPVQRGWRMLRPHEQVESGYKDRAMGLGRWDGFGSTYFSVQVLTATGTGGMPPETPTPEEVAGPLLERVAMPWTFGLRKWPPNDDYAFFGIRGWPMRALWCEYWVDYSPGPTSLLGGIQRVRGGLRVPINDPTSVWYDPPPAPTALPLRPVWAGLGLDTGFFAAVWWVAVAGFGGARRGMRRRRGCCAACGYDLRATPSGSPCPECGRSHSADAGRRPSSFTGAPPP